MKLAALSLLFLLSTFFCLRQLPEGGVTGYSGGSNATIVQPTSANPLAAACGQYVGGTTNTCSAPVNVTSGNELFILTAASSVQTLSAPTKSSGTATIGTITQIGSGCSATGTSCEGSMRWDQASITGSGSITITCNYGASTNVGCFPFEVSNYHSVDTGPVYHGLTGSFCSSACALASITPGTANDLLLVVSVNGAYTSSTVTPYLLSGNGNLTGNNISWTTANYTAPNTSTINPTLTPGTAYGGQNPQDSVVAVK